MVGVAREVEVAGVEVSAPMLPGKMSSVRLCTSMYDDSSRVYVLSWGEGRGRG